MSATALAASAAAVDDVAPFNEATLLALAAGDTARVDVQTSESAAIAFGDAPVEMVVDPDARRRGHGRRLLDELIETGESQFWAHGDLIGAQRLAAAAGLHAARTLLVLRRDVSPVDAVAPPTGITMRSATLRDIDAVVAVNARSFASHPEQGAMDRADFERRATSAWFDWNGLFVAEADDGSVVGFHWTKIEDGIGEVYVVGVDPSQQGSGLGTALTAHGLRHLVAAGVDAIDLYVEGDNAPALAVYRRLGFVEHARDVLYAINN